MNSLYVSQCFDGQQLLQDVRVDWQQDRILAVQAGVRPPSEQTQLQGTLCAGFIDIQVNGGGGVLFNQQPTVAALRRISDAHLQFGSTGLLPTLITDRLEVMQQGADAVAELLPQADHTVLGIHFEGPHLSVARRGIHPAEQIRPFTDAEMQLVCRSDLGKVLLTLAPETVPVSQIRELCTEGVLVSLGHSACTAEQALAALDAGACCFTHLFNAMSPLTSREPGMVGAALISPAYCGLILDHLHVHPLSALLAARCKGDDKLILVTDAMAHTGSPLQTLAYLNTEIRRDGLKLTLPDGTLAGSALDMTTALQHFCTDLALPLSFALKALSTNPARMLGLAQLGVVQAGSSASMLLLDSQLNLSQCWLHGEPQPLTQRNAE
ncbi:N-acetylglucosamine-6-phosphate deacetylase [Rheinheimera sp.]|uniref:N-acetylglucosamine-6-phosphate deacetylase n=1 Tax=Rheinheimera sp. TaxID=1869214 RepID=UPI00307F1CC2